MTIRVVGDVVGLEDLAAGALVGAENAVVVGEMSALVAAIYCIGTTQGQRDRLRGRCES